MTNEEIERHTGFPGITLSDLLDLARADEREKMTQEKFAEYFNTLQGGEVASAILTQLLRRGITDDDLRGLRLQCIKEQPEGVDVWVSMDKVDAVISTGEPERYEQDGANFFCGYGEVIETNVYDFAKLLSISPGECAKFRIVRVGE